MAAMEGLGRPAAKDEFPEFCELLERKDDEIGQGFYPTKLYPLAQIEGSGDAGSKTVKSDCSVIDQREAGPLLEDVQAARKRFPELSKKYCRVLDKAEGVWKKLITVN
jgi:hypothetical protein